MRAVLIAFGEKDLAVAYTKAAWYTYIITNYTNTVLYTGFTNSIERRILEHKKGIGSHFPKRYHLYKLVWCQKFSTTLEAMQMERTIKGWVRRKKIDLITKSNPYFKDLLTLR